MEKINSSIQRVMQYTNSPATRKTNDLNGNTRQSGIQVEPEGQHAPRDPTYESNQAVGLWQTPPTVPVDAYTVNPDISIGQPSPVDIIIVPEASSQLPSAQVLSKLVDLYFDLIYPWCPLFHKQTFIQEMHNPQYELLLHGIVAVCFRFWSTEDPDVTERDRHVAASREHILLHAVNTCTLISAQALVLLAVDALGQGTGPRAWNTMSLLATTTRHLGISVNPGLVIAVTESNTPLVRNDDDDPSIFPSIIEAEERVRLFWVFCSLDRFSSVAHGVPGGITTNTMRMAYPKSDSEWAAEAPKMLFNGSIRSWDNQANLTPDLWHQYVDLMSLADRCNQMLIQPVNLFDLVQCQRWQNNFRELDSTLAAWQISLPATIKIRPAIFDSMWYLLHANFHLIKIRMYTVAGFPSTTSPHVRPSTSARTRCRYTIRELASLSRSIEPSNYEELGPIFAFATWVAARSLIILWTSGHELFENVQEDMESLLSSLRVLGQYWQSATRYSDLIQLVLDTKDSPGGQSHLDIFSDTRRTAYGLEKCLGSLAERRNADIQPTSFDFLDMPFLDGGQSNNGWFSNFRLDGNAELF